MIDDMIDDLTIVYDSPLVGCILYWDIENESLIVPCLVPNILGNAPILNGYDIITHKFKNIDKGKRPIYIYLETTKGVHYVGIEGIYLNKDLKISNKKSSNDKWYDPSYIYGLQFPIKGYDEEFGGVLPIKDSYIYLNNYLIIDRDWLYDYAQKDETFSIVSNKGSLNTQVKILWKIHNIQHNKSDFIVSQEINEKNVLKHFDESYNPNTKKLRYDLIVSIPHFVSNFLVNNFKSGKTINPNLNYNFYDKKSNNLEYIKESKGLLVKQQYLTDMQLFLTIDNKIKNENLDYNSTIKWFKDEILNDDKVVFDLSSENIEKEAKEMWDFYKKQKDLIKNEYSNKRTLWVFNDDSNNFYMNINEKKIIQK